MKLNKELTFSIFALLFSCYSLCISYNGYCESRDLVIKAIQGTPEIKAAVWREKYGPISFLYKWELLEGSID